MFYLDVNPWPHSMLRTTVTSVGSSVTCLHQSSCRTLWSICQLMLASVKRSLVLSLNHHHHHHTPTEIGRELSWGSFWLCHRSCQSFGKAPNLAIQESSRLGRKSMHMSEEEWRAAILWFRSHNHLVQIPRESCSHVYTQYTQNSRHVYGSICIDFLGQWTQISS